MPGRGIVRGLLVLLCSLAGGGAMWGAGGVAVEGPDSSRILPPAGATITAYENVGYRLRLVDGEARIDVETSPLESRLIFSPPKKLMEGSVPRLASAVSAGARTQYDAVSRLLGWIVRNIEYDLDRQQAQDADAVLERRSGYCTGIARLAVAMIEAVGIPAREVPGFVLSDGQPDEVSGYHRWIEVYFEDTGWVFSDPLRTHHYVPASYLRLASNELSVTEPHPGVLIERRDRLRKVDLYPNGAPGVRARRNTDRQLAAALRVQVEGGRSGIAILEGEGLRRLHAMVSGETTFVGLQPGRYQLSLRLPGRPPLRRAVDLEGLVRRDLVLPLAAADMLAPRSGATAGRER